MFDIGWQELFIVAVLAIIVVGPRDLPRTLRTVMSYIRKVKGMARDFQNGIDDVAREVELDDIRREANKIGQMNLEEEVKKTLDPTGSLNKELDMSDVQKSIEETASQVNKTTADDIKIIEDSTQLATEADAGSETPSAKTNG